MTIESDTRGRLRRRPARHLRRGARRIAGSRVAMALAGLTTGGLLLLSAWHAASGAVAVAGMFAR
jgi:hypothetical protein